MAVDTRALDQGLPTLVSGSRSTGWWAILLLVLIEIMVFSSLVVSYFYLYSTAPQWPPAGTDPPKLMLPIIYSVILLATMPLAYLTGHAIARDDHRSHRLYTSVGIALLLVFLGLKYMEYSDLSYQWDTHAYGSIVWMIAAFHTAHVITVVLKSLVILALSFKGFFNSSRRSAVDGNVLYWIFVVSAWVPLFATLYVFPRLI